MVEGITLIASGYVRKVAIADSIAPIVDVRFAHPEAHNSWSLLIGVYLYAFQIYCDFSGYSSIAIGLARILGFDFGVNFDRPYFSRSFSEFWTRWHISLSSWLRDYLYIPLGGNRLGRWKTYRNLMITMLLGGLWHGASWTFVFWGALHGAYLVVEKLVKARLPALLQILLVFNLTCFAWVFFRAHSFSNAWQILRGIAAMHGSLLDIDNRGRILKCVCMIAVLAGFEAAAFLPKREDRVFSPAMRLAFVAACVWVVLIFGTFSGNNFIYFQF
jgi:D-alanyl-lipoteichoic acid acyltransferase DltB (MBOAT superfamily)